MLPLFSPDMLSKYFNEIAKLTLPQLDSYMYLKLTNNEGRFYSPSKIGYNHSHIVNNKVKINQTEKISARLEALKREDYLQNLDIIEHFWKSMEELKQ